MKTDMPDVVYVCRYQYGFTRCAGYNTNGTKCKHLFQPSFSPYENMCNLDGHQCAVTEYVKRSSKNA
jgi:hypothetical protein